MGSIRQCSLLVLSARQLRRLRVMVGELQSSFHAPACAAAPHLFPAKTGRMPLCAKPWQSAFTRKLSAGTRRAGLDASGRTAQLGSQESRKGICGQGNSEGRSSPSLVWLFVPSLLKRGNYDKPTQPCLLASAAVNPPFFILPRLFTYPLFDSECQASARGSVPSPATWLTTMASPSSLSRPVPRTERTMASMGSPSQPTAA